MCAWTKGLTGCAAGLFVFAAGCQTPDEVVTVRLSQVDVSTTESGDLNLRGLASPGMPERFVVPAKPARSLLAPGTRERLKAIADEVAADRELAYRKLSAKLRAAARAEVDRELRLETEKLWPKIDEGFRKSLDPVRQAFETYGRAREPLANLLARRGGFPDPDPLSSLNPRAVEGRERFDRQAAAETRPKLVQLDTEYERLRGSLVAKTWEQYLKELTALATAAEEKRARAELEADKEARKLADEGKVAFDTALDDGATKHLEASPAQEIVLVPRKAKPVPPFVRPEQAPGPSMQNHLELFLKVKQYRLAKPGESARDATREFLEWRSTFTDIR